MIALLRGINVGGHRVPMQRLRELFTAMDCTDVATYIASGNVCFRPPVGDNPPELADRLSIGLEDALGFPVPVFLRTLDGLGKMAAAGVEAFGPDAPPSHTQVIVFAGRVPEQVRPEVAALAGSKDRFLVAKREIFWRPAGRLSDSTVFKSGVEKTLGAPQVTVRKLATLLKMNERFRCS